MVGLRSQAGTKNRALHVKRYDPSQPQCQALIIKKDETTTANKIKDSKKELQEQIKKRDAKKKELEKAKQDLAEHYENMRLDEEAKAMPK